jgi:hypothetical protein
MVRRVGHEERSPAGPVVQRDASGRVHFGAFDAVDAILPKVGLPQRTVSRGGKLRVGGPYGNQ